MKVENPPIDELAKIDRALLQTELRYATLDGLLSGHYWGIFLLGGTLLGIRLDVVRFFPFAVWMGLGIGILLVADEVWKYIKTHRRGFGQTWTYPPTTQMLVRLALASVILAGLVEVMGLIVSGVYLPEKDRPSVIIGGILMAIGGGVNAYYKTSRDIKDRLEKN